MTVNAEVESEGEREHMSQSHRGVGLPLRQGLYQPLNRTGQSNFSCVPKVSRPEDSTGSKLIRSFVKAPPDRLPLQGATFIQHAPKGNLKVGLHRNPPQASSASAISNDSQIVPHDPCSYGSW